MSSIDEKYPQDLLSSYYASGFAPSAEGLPFGNKPTLIVIDVCDAYLTPASPLYAPERFHSALKNVELLIEESRAKQIPVIFTRVVYRNPGCGSNWYKHKIPKGLSCFDAGNKLGDYPAESEICRPRPGETVVEKQFSSSSFGTSLASILIGMKADTVIICGYSTSGCIRATTTGRHAIRVQPFRCRRCVW